MKLMVETGSNSGKKEGGGREKQRQLGRGKTDEYLEEKTPVEIIEERKQRLRTSRMDTRLGTPASRRKWRAGGKRKQLRIELGKDEKGSSQLDEKCTG